MKNLQNRKPHKSKGRILLSILLDLIFIVGICLLLYPTFSNWWNSNMASHAIADYQKAVKSISKEDYTSYLTAAREYNDSLRSAADRWSPDDPVNASYDSLLTIPGTDVMGYLSIPSIHVKLPIYHGTDAGVLQVGVGHLEGSSLPIGGIGTHAVLSGHTGLASARLLTDLDKLTVGDTFSITVLSEKLTYEVDQIQVVLPDEMDSLAIDPDKDYVTLVTCTPYGINSHRLLVRGHRVENPEESVACSADALQINPNWVAVGIGFVSLGLVLIAVLISKAIRKRKVKKL
ncbi:MAG: class C sortase [Lachnospiraceae bacterium]|nr:class C sortase [Lachnospiraceae bacterium]